MKIELLDEKTVKVVLSNFDMIDLNLTYDEMDYKNPSTKRVILKLVDRIKREVALDLTAVKLYIEAFPYADGGCILYVNMLDLGDKAKVNGKRYKTSFDTPILFSFKDLSALGGVTKRLLNRYSHIILKNSLYYYNNNYYLILYTYFKMDLQLTHLLNEYGSFYGKGATQNAFIREHGKEIIESEAIETLSGCL